ncbi:MAG TPA: hypothetical protein VIG67_08080 [Yaniella sp.]
MGNNAGQLALLAAGYALGKSKKLRTALLVAGGVAFGRMTAPSGDGEGKGSLLSGLANSDLANSAREIVTSTASKSLEALNENLQSRTEALRDQSSDESTGEEEEQTDEEQTPEESEEAETSEETSSNSKKSGGK